MTFLDVGQFPRHKETMYRAEEGAFEATIAQERLKIHRRRRLAEGAGAVKLEKPSSADARLVHKRGN
jgi:hypothetical protein